MKYTNSGNSGENVQDDWCILLSSWEFIPTSHLNAQRHFAQPQQEPEKEWGRHSRQRVSQQEDSTATVQVVDQAHHTNKTQIKLHSKWCGGLHNSQYHDYCGRTTNLAWGNKPTYSWTQCAQRIGRNERLIVECRTTTIGRKWTNTVTYHRGRTRIVSWNTEGRIVERNRDRVENSQRWWG